MNSPSDAPLSLIAQSSNRCARCPLHSTKSCCVSRIHIFLEAFERAHSLRPGTLSEIWESDPLPLGIANEAHSIRLRSLLRFPDTTVYLLFFFGCRCLCLRDQSENCRCCVCLHHSALGLTSLFAYKFNHTVALSFLSSAAFTMLSTDSTSFRAKSNHVLLGPAVTPV
jgi:hypothetical protein